MERIEINSKYNVKTSFDYDSFSFGSLVYNYLPIIGSASFSTYLFLLEDSKNSFINSILIPMNRILIMNDFLLETLKESISTLERVGLVEVLMHKTKTKSITFVLNKPLDAMLFEANLKLKETLSKKLDKINGKINNSYFERWKINSDEYTNLTTEIPFEKIKKETTQSPTISIHEQKLVLLKNTHPLKYIEILLDRKPNKNENSMIEILFEKYLFSQDLINLLIDFSMLKNKIIVSNYIIKIAKTIFDHNIKTFDELKNYLSFVLNNSKKTKDKQKDFSSKNKKAPLIYSEIKKQEVKQEETIDSDLMKLVF